MEKQLSFFGGTLVLEGIPRKEPNLPAVFLRSHGKWRTEAYQYASLLPWLRQHGVRDTVPCWRHLNHTLHEKRQPHDYQTKMLAAWHHAGRRGSIVLPTGAGKSYVAVQAIHQVKRSAVVVAPTIDLLHQRYRLLSHAFQTEISVYYGAEKSVHLVHCQSAQNSAALHAGPDLPHDTTNTNLKEEAMMNDPVLERLRQVCLTLPEAVETGGVGSPSFKVRSKIFAMRHSMDGRASLWYKAPPGAQEVLVHAHPERFFVPPYVGHHGWVGTWLDIPLDWDELAEMIRESYLMTAPKRLRTLLDAS